jgi:predicted RNA methylase
MKQRKLEMELQQLRTFVEPKVQLEQYHTPANIAASFIHCVHGNGHVEGLEVVDLGCGTGMLSVGCLLMGASKIVAIDVDEVTSLLRVHHWPQPHGTAQDALAIMRENMASLDAEMTARLEVRCADVLTVAELAADVVIMNPPFGTRAKGVDMAFLKVCC